tara:strand:+ start:3085 stop:3357 length:273 start_codon:yes stop_codon:yes gene_type:complete
VAYTWKLEASKAAIGANIGITKSWSQGRLIEAGAFAGDARKLSTESNPDVAVCKKGIQLYEATLYAIGWGVGCLAKVDKSAIARQRGGLS